MTSIHAHVTAIEHHASAIADLVTTNPNAALFTTNADVIPALERAFNLKPTIDAALAYAADQARAGDRVGSSRTIDYLIKELGLSYPTALNRLRLGHQHHGTIPDPEPDPAPSGKDPVPEPDNDVDVGDGEADNGAGEDSEGDEKQNREDEEEQRRREQAERDAADQQRKAEANRAKAREQARKSRVSQEKLTIINHELDHLNDHTTTRNDLFAEAVAQASQRLPHDLRDWVRTRVARANRTTANPHAAFTKRYLAIGDQDSNGGAKIHGYAPADTLALLDAALAPAQITHHDADPTGTDTRTLGQRRLDALAGIVRSHSAEKTTRTGVGTVIISMSAKDIDDMTDPNADHRYPTNTRAMLTPAEILRLGATKYNFAVVHDPDTGDPLHLGRTKRLATIEQRLALLATHLVCTNPDCTGAFCTCEIHHIHPWRYGGATDIDNLAGLCLRHHPDNRDQRDGQGARGHTAHDPDTGRRGYQPPPRPGNPHPAVQVNTTDRQDHSGGAKIRRQPWPRHTTTHPPGRQQQPPPSSDTPTIPDRGRPMPTPRAPVSPQPPGSGDPPSFEDMPPSPPPRHVRPRHRPGAPPQPPQPGQPAQPAQQPATGPPEQPPLFPLNGAG